MLHNWSPIILITYYASQRKDGSYFSCQNKKESSFCWWSCYSMLFNLFYLYADTRLGYKPGRPTSLQIVKAHDLEVWLSRKVARIQTSLRRQRGSPLHCCLISLHCCLISLLWVWFKLNNIRKGKEKIPRLNFIATRFRHIYLEPASLVNQQVQGTYLFRIKSSYRKTMT